MSRPNKEGLDYFPLDCKMDDKIYMVEAELGLEGFALLIKLLMKIYSESYYIEWTERKAKIFARQNNTNFEVVNILIDVCLNEDIFNKKLYKKYHILTSNGIQKRYFHSVKNRKDIYVIREYLVDGISNYLDNVVNVHINPVNVHINLVKPKDNSHSIVKNSKEKNSKEIIIPLPLKSGKKKEDSSLIREIVTYLNIKTGKGFRPETIITRKFIKARLKDGYDLDAFKWVIDIKCAEWKDQKDMDKYLRPETLFGNKFESYLNQSKYKETK